MKKRILTALTNCLILYCLLTAKQFLNYHVNSLGPIESDLLSLILEIKAWIVKLVNSL